MPHLTLDYIESLTKQAVIQLQPGGPEFTVEFVPLCPVTSRLVLDATHEIAVAKNKVALHEATQRQMDLLILTVSRAFVEPKMSVEFVTTKLPLGALISLWKVLSQDVDMSQVVSGNTNDDVN